MGHVNPPPTHPEPLSPLQTPFKSSDLIPTLMLRQDRQSGTITRKQEEEEGGEAREEGRKQEQRAFQCYTEGKLGIKSRPLRPWGSLLSLHQRGDKTRRERKVSRRCAFSLFLLRLCSLSSVGPFMSSEWLKEESVIGSSTTFGHVKQMDWCERQ